MPPDSVMIFALRLSHSDNARSTFSRCAGLAGRPNKPRLNVTVVHTVSNAVADQVVEGAGGVLVPLTDNAFVIDLAREQGYRDLPTTDVEALTNWFDQGMPENSLETYLTTFTHTVALMQNEEAIRRVTREWVEDVAAEGVDYGEVRIAPELLTNDGLSMQRVVDVIADELSAAGAQHGVVAALIMKPDFPWSNREMLLKGMQDIVIKGILRTA